MAPDYVTHTEGAHASINFRISHLGYSWLTGRFKWGVSGETSFQLADYGTDYNLDPASETVHLQLQVEGIRQ